MPQKREQVIHWSTALLITASFFLALLPGTFTILLVVLELSSYNRYRDAMDFFGYSGIMLSLGGIVYSFLACLLSTLQKYDNVATCAFVLILFNMLCVYLNICAFL